MNEAKQVWGSPPQGGVLNGCRAAVIGIGVFSGLINVLYLTGSFYMLQVYDRVIPSRSVPTLIALSLLASLLFAGQAALDFCRMRLLSRIGRSLDERLSSRVFQLVARLPLTGVHDGVQPIHDLDRVRSFLTGAGPLGFFDLPWVPFYIGICFLFHPAIGVAALFGALMLAVLAACTEGATRGPMKETAAHGAARAALAEACRRNAEAIASMGLAPQLRAKWEAINARHLDAHERVSDIAGGLGSVSKVARMALQSGVLGLGAYLVINAEASAGVIIASSILTARSLAPLEQIIGHWRAFAGARQSWSRLRLLLARHPKPAPRLPLRAPASSLTVEGLGLVPPGGKDFVVRGVAFELSAGHALGVIGPSGSGKSSLARGLVGAWTPAQGKVRLDGAALDQWSPEALGRHIGYLPQDVELFDGTIAENIARFEQHYSAEATIRAAEQAGVHDLIVSLPAGYETRVGEGGMALSGGQRQRIGLARALYKEPFLVVLDEPNSNLDHDGDLALTRAISGIRMRGGVAVVIAHRPSALAAVDQLLVMANGAQNALGPRDDVVRRTIRSAPSPVQSPIAGAA